MIANLPDITSRDKGVKTFVIPDSIEGWADAIGVLISSYCVSDSTFPEYSGYRVDFDYSEIRGKGATISGGFKAPGPDGLRKSITLMQDLLGKVLLEGNRLHPIHCYDLVMHMSDAVLSGGVRRSATICMFSFEDKEMMNAKTGNWMTENPQRARSNNSVMLLRDSITEQQFKDIMESVKQFGEPGFVFTDDLDICFNPCVEIGMYPKYQHEDGTWESGWQGCNLTTMNGKKANSSQDFYEMCMASAILGTLQAGYTDFKYVGEVSKKIFEREALLGCSVTGWANNPDVLFNEEVQRAGAGIVRETNAKIAELIKINQAARTTCCKPEGNASVILESASGIHGDHAPRYFRNMQANKQSDAAQLFLDTNPESCEDSVWSRGNTDHITCFPIKAKEGSLFKQQLLGVRQLELVKLTQQNWVEYGTNKDLCVMDKTRHNVSNTIQVDNWDEVADYIYDNREFFAGISLLSVSGDKDYPQAPFVQVFTEEELLEMYGKAAMFASGLIVDGLHAFDGDLWKACSTTMYDETVDDIFKKDWVRRLRQFADRIL